VQRNIRKLVIFAGLPLAAIALAVFLLSAGSGQKAEATADGVNFSLSSTGCDTTATGAAKCEVPEGSNFTVSFNLVAQAAGGYTGYDATFAWSGDINYHLGSMDQSFWKDGVVSGPKPNGNNGCTVQVGDSGAVGTPKTDITQLAEGSVGTACTQGTSATASSAYTGSMLTLVFDCKSGGPTGVGTVTLVQAGTDLTGTTAGTSVEKGPDEVLTVNCNPASATPVPTATSTPPAIPFVNKLPVLQNVFLQRNGTKIPPATCEAGTSFATLTETLKGPILSQDPKEAPGVFQKLAAFEFEVRFDPKMVCVSIVAGSLFSGPTAACSTVTAKGIVRFGCVTIGKGAGINGPGALAVITVRPQPELYSQLRPNQDNGIPVQILNQGCNLSDEQGHEIPISSCEDADITFRYLEGDVTGPNCDVGVADSQNIAMRWGATKGSLLYQSFLDLSPSGQIKGDGRIDIKDLQFVFGRLGSACPPGTPWPAQLPVNPKI
jgi:hypothetical protein